MLLYSGRFNPTHGLNGVAPQETNCLPACHYHINSASAVHKGPQHTYSGSQTHTHTHTHTVSSFLFFILFFFFKQSCGCSPLKSLFFECYWKNTLEKNKDGWWRQRKRWEKRQPTPAEASFIDAEFFKEGVGFICKTLHKDWGHFCVFLTVVVCMSLCFHLLHVFCVEKKKNRWKVC